MHPLLCGWDEHVALLDANGADVATLEQARDVAESIDGIARPQFRAQTADLLADGLHYELRIAERGILATRERSPHDLFNALVWLRHPQLKHALNARQVADIRALGPKQRTRGQCALTHFDEAGAIVWLAEPALLECWDAHDWNALFLHRRAAWGVQIAVSVFGHALLEHVWRGSVLPVAKALVVRVPSRLLAQQRIADGALVARWPSAEAFVGARIADARLLADPQELRPLPLAGIPCWHPENATGSFFSRAPCFRPLRPGRRYPQPPGFAA